MANLTADLQSFKCLWRTVTDFRPSQGGELTVKARSLADAIAVAKQKIYEQHSLGSKYVVVYEVEESFL